MKRNLLLVGLLLLVTALPASANWTATGTFQYQHREWDQTGFTGTMVSRPIRFADVEIIDPTKSGAKQVLASGKTDATGAYSISVVDSSTRSQVAVRALTRTTNTTDLYVKVTNQSG